jgi:EmrB/QacA subfamily drug resistance transporter
MENQMPGGMASVAHLKRTPAQKYTLAVMALISFIVTFASSSINLALPDIALYFNSSASMLGWTVTGYTLANAAFAVPFGRIADLSGRKRIFIIGVSVFVLISFMCIFSRSVLMLIIFRLTQGIGGAMIFSTSSAILISEFPPQERGKILGYVVAATYAGISLGPVAGGIMNHYLGWRSIFIFSTLAALLVLILAVVKMPASKPNAKGHMDIFGNIVYVTMILCLMYGFSSFGSSLTSKLLVLVACALFFVFILHELKTDSPIMEVRLFARDRGYAFSNLAALLNYGATFALGYLMSIYLQVIRGYDSQAAGLIMISQPLLMTLLTPFAGRLSDRLSPFKMSSFGMALCTVSMFSFIFISAETSLTRIIFNLVLMGAGIGFFSTPNTNAVMSCVSPRDFGVTSSTLSTMRSIGQTASMAIFTLIVSANLKTAPFAEAPADLLIKIMKTGFIIFTIICFSGTFISLLRKKKKQA